MIAQVLTESQMRQCDGRNYNPQIWDANIDRYSKYEDVRFYLVPACKVYSYDRYFVEYTLPEGLRLFASFGYSSSITNGGFYRLDKIQCTKDGKTTIDAVKLFQEGKDDEAKALFSEVNRSFYLEITCGQFYDSETGKPCVIGTTQEARRWMIERSTKYGLTFTKGGF